MDIATTGNPITSSTMFRAEVKPLKADWPI